MTQVPLSTLLKPQLLKETVEGPETVMTGSIRAWIANGIGNQGRGGMRQGDRRGRERRIENRVNRGSFPKEGYAFEAGSAHYRKKNGGGTRGCRHILVSLTIGRLDPHVLERDKGGALDDHFDRLLPVNAADVAFALGRFAGRAIALVADGGFEREVVGSHDVDTGDPVVVDLLTQ